MYSLPILPDTMRVDLSRIALKAKAEGAEAEGEAVICEYPGVVAIVRPLDLEASSRWSDEFPNADHRAWAATKLVKDHLVSFEGLSCKDGDDDVPFDVKNERHFRSLPMDMRSGIFIALRDRASIDEETEKNSDLPSVSGGTSGTGITTAEQQVQPLANG